MIMSVVQLVAFSLSAVICFLAVRSCTSGWKMFLVGTAGYAASLVAGVGVGTFLLNPDAEAIARMMASVFWVSLFGVIAGSFYGRRQRRKNIQSEMLAVDAVSNEVCDSSHGR